MKKFTTKKRAALIGLLALGLVCTATGGALYSVEAAPADAPSFAIKETASIRTNAPAGIRFETTIEKTEYETLKANGATFGTIVQSETLYEQNGKVLEKGQAESVDIAATNWKILAEDDLETTDVDESTHNQYNAVLVGEKDPVTGEYAGLPQELYGVRLVARSYVTYENGTTEYGDNVAIRSIADVAKAAILDTTRTYGADEYAYFHDITDYVANQNPLTAAEVNVAATEINGAVALGTSYGEVKAVYVLDGNDMAIAAENWTYADGTLTFTADYLKALPYGEYTLKLFTDNAVLSLPTTIYGAVATTPSTTIGFDNTTEAGYVANETEWLTSYEGATGVAKVTVEKASWADMNFKLPEEMVNEIKADTKWDYKNPEFYLSSSWWSGGFNYGEWTLIKVKRSSITDTLFENLTTGGTFFEKNGACGNDSEHFYIDYISFEDSITTLSNEFGEPSSTAYLYKQNSSWKDSYEEKSGVVATSASGSGGRIILNLLTDLTVDEVKALEWDYIEVDIYLQTTASSMVLYHDYNSQAIFSWGFATNQWKTLKITKATLLGCYNDSNTMYSKISNSGSGLDLIRTNTSTDDAMLYIDSIKFVSLSAVGAIDFDNDSDLTLLKSYGTRVEPKIVESVSDTAGSVTEYGVIEYAHTETARDGIQFAFDNANNLTTDDWDYISIRIRILRGPNNSNPNSEGSYSYSWRVGGTEVTMSEFAPDGKYSGWVTYRITKSMLEAAVDWDGVEGFWTAFTSENGVKLCDVDWIAGDGGATIQIAQIGLVKVVNR